MCLSSCGNWNAGARTCFETYLMYDLIPILRRLLYFVFFECLSASSPRQLSPLLSQHVRSLWLLLLLLLM